MKQTLTLWFALLTTMTVGAATTVDKDSLRYTLNDDGSATVSECLYKSTPSITIPQTVKSGGKTYTVKYIGEYAFDQRTFITSVTFPNTLEKMAFCSFRWCTNLTSVSIPASLKEFSSSNFSECWNLQTVTIAAGSQMTKVDEAAFYNCNKLTSINLPSTVTELGNSAFYICRSLPSITLPSALTSIGNYAFDGCYALSNVTLPSKVTSIGEYAFYQCKAMTSLTIPSKVTSIGQYAFSECEGLTSATINATAITTIPKDCFSRCKLMERINIPSSVTTIGEGAFYECYALTGVTLPANLTTISGYSFGYCQALTSITIPSKVTSIGQWAFYNCTMLESVNMKPATMTSIGQYAFCYCEKLTAFRVPEGVTTLPYETFYRCKALEQLTLPSTLTSIGENACRETSIKNLSLPEGLTNIGNYAFQNCDSLTAITLPASIQSLGTYVFSGCDKVESVTFLGNSDVELIGESHFSSQPNQKSVRLPNGLTLITRSMFYGNKQLKSIDLSKTKVTEMLPFAFYENTALTTVKLPNTLTSIGEYAFYNCKQLNSINFPTALKSIGYNAFQYNNLPSLQLPSGLETIGGYAFADSKNLSAIPVVIPQTVTSIGNYAFSNCDQMTSFTFPKTTLTTLGEYALDNCDNLQTVVFPKNLTTIPRSTCGTCKKLSSVTLPENLETVGYAAFYEANSLYSITLPTTVKTIEPFAFYHVFMPTLTLPEGLETIGYQAFRGCDRLKELILPSTLKQMDNAAFYYCDSLYTVTFPENASNLTFNGREHFKNCPRLVKVTLPKTGMTTIPNNMFENCVRLRNIELPATLTSIGDDAFYGCDSLQTIYIPDGVKSIGYEAFDYCRGLRYVRLPEGLESIGQACFGYTERLPFINIPSTVTSIGNWAIHTTATSSNTNFKSIGIMGSTMPGTSNHVFWQHQPAFSLLVPAGQEKDYQNSTSWTPDATDNRTIKGYPATKKTLTKDLIHLYTPSAETYFTGSPEAILVEWFEGMGNYQVFYTDKKGNKTTKMPEKSGDYTISLVFEEGPYYKPATFNNIGTFTIQEIADEDFALLWDFYSKTYDRTKQKSTWTGGGGGGAPANWNLVEGRKESAAGIFGVKWNKGHVEEINMGAGTSIYNLNGSETPVSLFALPKVKKIDMQNVEFYGNISDKVEAWLASGKKLSPTLEYLDLERNKLEGNISTLVNNLPALKTLDVHQNRFSTVWPALAETLESVDISNQTITDIVATVDLRDMTEAGFFSTLPSIVFYDPTTRTYAEDISINVKSQTNWDSFNLNYVGDNDFNITGYCTWKGASGDEAQCSYTDSKNKTTSFKANFFYDMGDVDFNGEVNVIDLQQSIQYLFNDGASYPTYRYNFTAGDLNTDKAINVLDIVKHVDLLLSQDKPTTAEAKARKIQDTADIEEVAAKLYQKDGRIMLKSIQPVAAIDMVVNATDAERISWLNHAGMTTAKKSLADGRVHIIIYSAAGKTLPTGESILAVNVENGSVSEAMLVDSKAKAINVALNDADVELTTDIESLSPTLSEGEETWYTIDGLKLQAKPIEKGVYIVNGKKVIIK